MSPSVPAGMQLTLDASVRRYAGGTVLIGGSPTRLMRLSAHGVRRLEAWLAGGTVGDGDGVLARRLLDAGLAHPRPAVSHHCPHEVTLVVPVRDNPSGVTRLLGVTGELAARIVVDDGSAAPLVHATVRHHWPAGPAAARNTGWRLADTDLVAFLDSDVVPQPGWLDGLLPLFADPLVVAVAPRVSGAPGGGIVSRYERDRCGLDMGERPAAVRPMSRVGYVPSAALIVRRSALSAVGGFDETLRYGEDVDLGWRLIAAGGIVRYQPTATVHHRSRSTVRSWLRQRFHYGTSAAPLADRHPGKLSCARLPWWSALAWAVTAAGHPVSGLAVAVAAAGPLTRDLHGKGVPAAASVQFAVRGHLDAGRLLADAIRRAWWPLALIALLAKPGRVALVAGLLPCLIEAVRSHHDLDRARWAALRIADDLAYAAGVWVGCARQRTIAPLAPRLTGRRR